MLYNVIPLEPCTDIISIAVKLYLTKVHDENFMKKGNNLMKLLTIKDTALIFCNKSESTIRTWLRRKVIPDKCQIKIGGSIFIDETALLDHLQTLHEGIN